MALDELVSHDDSLAKKAVAFFKISRSMRSRWFSARRRRSSSSTAGRLPLPGKAWSPSAARAVFQLLSRLSPRPSSRATSARLLPSPAIRRTASTLNSRVKLRLGFAIADLLTVSLRSYRSARHSWGSPVVGVQRVHQRRPFLDDPHPRMAMAVDPTLMPLGQAEPTLQIEIV